MARSQFRVLVGPSAGHSSKGVLHLREVRNGGDNCYIYQRKGRNSACSGNGSFDERKPHLNLIKNLGMTRTLGQLNLYVNLVSLYGVSY